MVERVLLFLPCQRAFSILVKQTSFALIPLRTNVGGGRPIWVFFLGFGLLVFGCLARSRARKPKASSVPMQPVNGKKSPCTRGPEGERAVRELAGRAAPCIIGLIAVSIATGLIVYSVRKSLSGDGLSGVLYIASALAVLVIVAMVAFGAAASCRVFVREGGHHFHQKECPYLKDIQIVPRSHAIKMGFGACRFCDPSSSELSDAVFIRRGGRHFHREECDLLSRIQPMRKRKALAAGFEPCHRCRS